MIISLCHHEEAIPAGFLFIGEKKFQQYLCPVCNKCCDTVSAFAEPMMDAVKMVENIDWVNKKKEKNNIQQWRP